MSNITGTIRARATVEAGSDPVIYNVTATLANTEYAQALNTSTKQFMIRVRGQAKLKLAFDVGTSGTNYVTVPMGCSYTHDGLAFSGTLYFQTNKPSQIVEILEWT